MFDWFRLFNMEEFTDSDLPSYEFQAICGDYGLKDFIATKGNKTGVLIDDVFLCVDMNDKNPTRFGERALFLDENDDIWIGFYRED